MPFGIKKKDENLEIDNSNSQVEDLLKQINELKNQNADLSMKATEDFLVSTIKKFGMEQGDLVSNLKEGKTSLEDTLVEVLKGAVTSYDNLKTSFKNTAPVVAGAVDSTTDDNEKEPADKVEAFTLVQNKFGLSASDSLVKAAELYPNLYKKEND